MSHIVQVQTEIRDHEAVGAACRRLQLPAPALGKHEMYQGQATGLAVQLPGWQYPVVCDLASGQIQLDNFGGRWGERAKLDQFLQTYAVEKTKIEARKKGHVVFEQPLEDGSIKLTIQVAGGAA